MTKSTDTENPFLSTEMPFGKSITRDEVFRYMQFEELHSILRLALTSRAMSLVTGQAGAGKTTGVRSFIDDLPTNKFLPVYLGQDQDGSIMWERLALSLGLAPKRFKSQMWLQINQFLSDNLHEQGKEIVLIIDEAHLLSNQTLEEIRLLTNADFDRVSPLSIILLGQLSLRTRLRAVGFEAINQRLRFRYAMEGFTESDSAAYIKHRLRLVGAKDDLFSPEATKHIFLASQGIPREINNLCTVAWLRARSLGVSKIDVKLVNQVLDQREID